jgi:glucose/arabinose dehydrogenase
MVRRIMVCMGGLLVLVLAAACGRSGGITTPSGSTSAGIARSVARVPVRRTARVADSGLSFVRVRVSVPPGNGGGVFSTRRWLTVPRGWRAEVWARLSAARFMAWTPQHTLLVSVPAAGDVVEFDPRANPSLPPLEHVLLDRLTQPQGLAFGTLHGQRVLYVAESDEIDRYVWSGVAGVGARTVIVRALPDLDPRGDDVHRAKTLVVGPGHRIYVNIGSAFNASTIDVKGNPPRASIVSYSPSGTDMRVVATGVRNGEGLSFAPDGVLWTAINERDSIPYPFHDSYGGLSDAYGHLIQAYINEHPPDELVAVNPGRDVGWPYCNPDPRHGLADMGFDDDVQNNPGGTRLDCARLRPINRGLPAHSAPLGFHFLQGSSLPARWTHGAVVAVHGSWDREPPRAPAVLWLPWSSSSRTLGAPVTLISGFQSPNGSRWGRAVDALPGPDGALYVSDDAAGAIYRLVP